MSKSRKPNRRFHQQERVSLRFWAILGFTVCVTLLVVAYAVITSSHAAQAGINTGPSSIHYWNLSQNELYGKRQAKTDSRAYYLGDSITLPNGLKLQVLRVQRNWQAPAAVVATYGKIHSGDDPTGKEVILVWFKASNTGTTPLVYNDSMFSLQMPGKAEQRVANLATLLPTSYGDMGVEPWLLQGQSTTTFVPFLITPGATPTSFQYYIAPLKSGSASVLIRLSILLHSPQGRSVGQFTFTANKMISI